MAVLRPAARIQLLSLGLALAELAFAPALHAQLTALGSAQIDQCAGPDACEANDRSGSAIAAADFDGDGFADLAVGAPTEATGGATEAGLVQIYYGSSAGLSAARSQVFTQETSGVPGTSEQSDHFGAALAAGDLDGDGFADLAIGAPDEDIGSTTQAGMVVVLFGSATGLSGSGAVEFDQSNLPLEPGCSFSESPETRDQFGYALAIGGNVVTELVIGVPLEDGFFFGQTDAGEIVEIFGFGIDPRGSSCPRFQDSFPACSGDSGVENDDQFGQAVAARRILSVGSDPIAGAWLDETASGVTNSGVVNTVDACLQQNGSLAGAEESGDLFGAALATGDFDDDGREDLAIGVPGEGAGSIAGAGGVAVVYANLADNLSTDRNQFFIQDSFLPDSGSEVDDHFGAALAAGDFDGDGRDDLAIGAPHDDVDGQANAGVVNVLYSAGPSGLDAAGGQTFDQNFPAAIPSVSEAGDTFGAALAAGDFDGNGADDLAIGVPFETGAASAMGVVDVLYGLDRTNGAFGTVSFTTGAITVSEGAPFTFVIADRVGGAVLAATVNHSRLGGSATPGVDFNYTPGTFGWDVGDLSTDTKVITLVDDSTDEPNETLVLRLSTPSPGLALGAHPTITITIVDDDPPGQLFADGFESGNLSKWSVQVP